MKLFMMVRVVFKRYCMREPFYDFWATIVKSGVLATKAKARKGQEQQERGKGLTSHCRLCDLGQISSFVQLFHQVDSNCTKVCIYVQIAEFPWNISYNVCYAEKLTKCSSILLLCLVSFPG